MSAIEKMFAGMLKEAIPPEILAQLTPENFKKIVDAATNLSNEVRNGLTEVKNTQEVHTGQLEGLFDEVAHILALLEQSSVTSAGHGDSDGTIKRARSRAVPAE